MNEFLVLSKYELISRLQSINRENERLKTLLMKTQLMTHFYQKLYENCIQFNNDFNNISLKKQLKSKQTLLLTQIQSILKCDKSIEISLPKLQSQAIPPNHLFIEKSTQYEIEDNLMTNKDQKCVQNDYQLVTNYIDINLNDNSNNTPIDSSIVLSGNDLQTNITPIAINKELIIESINESKDKNIKNIKKFCCIYCNKKYKIKKSLDKHIIKTHNYIKNGLNVENNTKRDDKTIALKITPKSNDMIVCQWPECHLKFGNRTQFLRHYSIHKESRKLCSDCGLRFDDSDQLREHMIWHSKQTINGFNYCQTEEPIDCEKTLQLKCNFNDFCEFSCNNEIEFTKHYTKHLTTNRPFSCHFPNCKYKTANYHNLEVHQNKAHQKVYMSL